jgi:transcriptional regulator of acetoin/glycerol metabolism
MEEARVSPKIAGRFLREVGGRVEVRISPSFLGRLVRWEYTTNVREIAGMLSRSMAESAGEVLSMPPEMRAVRSAPPAPAAEMTEARVRAVLAAERNVSQAARALGVDRSALYRLMKKYRIA